MTSTEILIEAVMYAAESDINWWEVFDSLAEARKIINSAAKQEPDESQIACMLAAREDEDLYELYTPEEAYSRTIKKLKKELREAREE